MSCALAERGSRHVAVLSRPRIRRSCFPFVLAELDYLILTGPGVDAEQGVPPAARSGSFRRTAEPGPMVAPTSRLVLCAVNRCHKL